jgi:hypothetical protein
MIHLKCGALPAILTKERHVRCTVLNQAAFINRCCHAGSIVVCYSLCAFSARSRSFKICAVTTRSRIGPDRHVRRGIGDGAQLTRNQNPRILRIQSDVERPKHKRRGLLRQIYRKVLKLKTEVGGYPGWVQGHEEEDSYV